MTLSFRGFSLTKCTAKQKRKKMVLFECKSFKSVNIIALNVLREKII